MAGNSRVGLGLAGVVVCLAISCAGPDGAEVADSHPASSEAAPKGAYLGQQPPGSTPSLFAPGFVSTGLAERDVAMTPDGREFYFSGQIDAGAFSAILMTRETEGGWSRPEVASFSGRYTDLEPAISPDGSRFFFLSKRPDPGSPEAEPNEDIWTMNRVGDGWGEPRSLGAPINSEQAEFFPSVTRDGTLYFTRRSDDRTESIYRSRWENGAYQEPELLGPEVNSGETRFNAFVAPDESYLIVCTWGSEDSLGGVDYYVVFRSPDDRWSQPVNLGEPVNTATGREWSPYVSPDGRYLFFMSSRLEAADDEPGAALSYDDLQRHHNEPKNGNPDIWWIDAGFIEELRPEGF